MLRVGQMLELEKGEGPRRMKDISSDGERALGRLPVEKL